MDKKIISYKDLDVYQRSYKACILIMTKVIPKLPESEGYDLKDQSLPSSRYLSKIYRGEIS